MEQEDRKREMARRKRRVQAKRRREQEEQRKRARARKKKRNIILILILLVVVGIGIALWATGFFGRLGSAKITITAESQTMIQDEEKKDFTVKVTSETDPKKVINRNTGFTVQDLLDDLNSGIGYTCTSEGDGTVEGEFPIQVSLEEYMQDRIENEWNGKVKVETVEGELVVQNKYGAWDGTKFKRHDGSYVMDDFIESRGDRYYFNADGEMVTGEMKKGFTTYVFDAEGKLVSEESSLDVNKPMVALTYDDGPGARTGELLDYLEQNEAHASFFLLGECISDSNGQYIKRMVDIGCEVANHSFSHPQLTKLSDEGIKEEINKTNAKIAEMTGGVTATLMRPPYGAINDTVRGAVGMPMIMWSVDTLDWKTRNAQSTIDHVMSNVKDGDIILMHDIHSATIDASEQLIPKLQAAGYQLVTVSELAEARGIVMEAGQSYSEFWKD